MNGQMTYRGRTYKTVVVSGLTLDTSTADVLAVAYRVAGEDASSLFGHHVSHAWLGDDNVSRVTVDLYTD